MSETGVHTEYSIYRKCKNTGRPNHWGNKSEQQLPLTWRAVDIAQNGLAGTQDDRNVLGLTGVWGLY